MEIKKILWPTDLSENAAAVLPYVTSLAQKYQLEIHLLYVAQDLCHHEAWYGEFNAEHIARLRDWELKTAGKRLEELCTDHLEGCSLYHKHIVIGDAAEEILKAISKEGVDLVVMATPGMKGHFTFGSVTDKVVKNSSVPVLTVNPLNLKK